MKCSTCGKDIPETSQVCPFCFTAIEQQPTPSVNPEDINNTGALTSINTSFADGTNSLNFGDLDSNTTYDSDHNTLQTYFKEPKQRRKLLIPIFGVLLGFIVLFIVLKVIKGPTIESYKYYTGIVDSVYNYVNDNFTSRDVKNTGKYKIYYTIDGETKEFRGDYQLDLHKRLLDITAELKNPEEEQGGIVLNDKTLDLEFVGKNANLYFIGSDIAQDTILLPYEDETGLLTSKYNLDSIVDGVHDAINAGLKSLSYTEEKDVNVFLRDKEMKINKKVLKLDYNAKKKFISVFYDTLLDDYNFLSEYAKTKDSKAEEIEQILKNIKTSNELKYSSDDGKTTYVNIYYKGKDIYRLEINNQAYENSYAYVDFNDNKITIEYYKDGAIVQKLTMTRVDSYMNDVLTRTYMFEYTASEKTVVINLEITKNNNPTVKVKDIDNSKSIRDFSDEEIQGLKSKIGLYTKNTEWVDKLKTIFGSVCSNKLSCICNSDDTCRCSHNNNVITCPRSVVEAPEPANNLITE